MARTRGNFGRRSPKDVLDLDLAVAGRPGGGREERYVWLGVIWQSGRFLP